MKKKKIFFLVLLIALIILPLIIMSKKANLEKEFITGLNTNQLKNYIAIVDLFYVTIGIYSSISIGAIIYILKELFKKNN